jgi:hypothetical protein
MTPQLEGNVPKVMSVLADSTGIHAKPVRDLADPAPTDLLHGMLIHSSTVSFESLVNAGISRCLTFLV